MGEGNETARAAWFAALADMLGSLDVFGRGLLLIDLGSGAIVGANAAAAELFGGTRPATLRDLVEAGHVARPELTRLRRGYVAWRDRCDPDAEDRDASHGWTDEVVVRRAGADPVAVRLKIAVHRRPSLGAEAALVTARPLDDEPEPIDAERVESLPDLWAVYDTDLKMVAADPAMADHGLDPRSQLGVMAWMYAHPDDVPLSLPLLFDVVHGRTRVARYSIRIRAQQGRWLPVNVEARRLETDDRPLVLIVVRYVNDRRRSVGPDDLSARELSMVVGLFDGLRVGQLAERHQISPKTVRHHLASVYRKLEVSGQIELLETFHRPTPVG